MHATHGHTTIYSAHFTKCWVATRQSLTIYWTHCKWFVSIYLPQNGMQNTFHVDSSVFFLFFLVRFSFVCVCCSCGLSIRIGFSSGRKGIAMQSLYFNTGIGSGMLALFLWLFSTCWQNENIQVTCVCMRGSGMAVDICYIKFALVIRYTITGLL